MIEISFGKLFLLAIIALIVLGPEKLPSVARTAGALLRRMRSGWDDVRAEVERELQIEEIKRTAREAVAQADAAQAGLDATLQQVRDVQQLGSANALPKKGDSPDPSEADATALNLEPSTAAEQASGNLLDEAAVTPATEVRHGDV